MIELKGLFKLAPAFKQLNISRKKETHILGIGTKFGKMLIKRTFTVAKAMRKIF